MPKKPNTRKIGLFMIAGFAFLIIVLLVSFGSRFTSGTSLAIMHFDESIRGLNVGAPVVFNGVEIGKVSDITFAIDTTTMDIDISVYARIDNKNHSNFSNYINHHDFLEELIEKGLRAKLTNQSILTGQLMVELAIMPDTDAVFRNKEMDDDDTPEIPTVLSPMGQLSQGLQDLHLKENMEKLNSILNKLNDDVLPGTEELLTRLNTALSENKEGIKASINNFNETMISLKKGAKSFKTFTNYIEQHPESILTGKGAE